MYQYNSLLWSYIICFFVVVIAIVVVVAAYKVVKTKEKILNQKEEILQYQSNLEEIYDMMRIFRHDYKNTILALKGCCIENDYEKISEILDAITKDFEKIDMRHHVNVVSNLEDSALKWLLISKLASAQKKGISVSLLVSNTIGYGKLKPYEFNSIIGNLLDNAIEAAAESEKKQLRVAFHNKNGDTIISVKNTYKDRPVTKNLYEKGVSGKKGHCGYGLYGVKKIIEKHKEVLMDVKVTDDCFFVYVNINCA